jgi:hypothetical protein
MRNGNGHWFNVESAWFDGKREALHEFGDLVRVYGNTVTEQIKAHPLAAIGIAFAAGYLVTRVARR